MIQIKCNDNSISEKKYIFDIIFLEFLGLNWELLINNSINEIQLKLNNSDDLVIMPDIFFIYYHKII